MADISQTVSYNDHNNNPHDIDVKTNTDDVAVKVARQQKDLNGQPATKVTIESHYNDGQTGTQHCTVTPADRFNYIECDQETKRPEGSPYQPGKGSSIFSELSSAYDRLRGIPDAPLPPPSATTPSSVPTPRR